MRGQLRDCGCRGRDIPAEVKRVVRQRCGFGCVICGLPIIEYHHVRPWSTVKEHDPTNITLLCNNCHRRVGAGLIPPEALIGAMNDPQSLKMGETSPERVWMMGSMCRILLGPLELIFYPTAPILAPIMIDDLAVFGIRMNEERISIDLHPFPSLRRGLRIVDNEVSIAPVFWDVTWVGTRLSINVKRRGILFRIAFEPPHTIRIEKGVFVYAGLGIIVDPSEVSILNTQSSIGGLRLDGYDVGLLVGDNSGVNAGLPIRVDRGDSRRSIASPPEF